MNEYLWRIAEFLFDISSVSIELKGKVPPSILLIRDECVSNEKPMFPQFNKLKVAPIMLLLDLTLKGLFHSQRGEICNECCDCSWKRRMVEINLYNDFELN